MQVKYGFRLSTLLRVLIVKGLAFHVSSSTQEANRKRS